MFNLRSAPARGSASAVAVLVALACLLGFTSPVEASHQGGWSPVVAKNDQGMMKARVSGTTEDGRRVAGTFTPESFSVVDDHLVSTGTLDLVIRGKGKPVRHSLDDVTFQVVEAAGPGLINASGGPGRLGTSVALPACDILNLVLGPLDLNVLGLEIHLAQVVLDIVAQSGPGNLLGNLLCAVAGLLDGSPLGGLLTQVLGQLSDLLNQILGALDL
jgi:hypothetical protein